MKNRPDDASWLTADERAELNQALAVEQQEAQRVSPQSAWSALLDRRVLAFGLIYFGINIGVVALSFFLPQIVAEFSRTFAMKYSVLQIGLITAIPSARAVNPNTMSAMASAPGPMFFRCRRHRRSP